MTGELEGDLLSLCKSVRDTFFAAVVSGTAKAQFAPFVQETLHIKRGAIAELTYSKTNTIRGLDMSPHDLGACVEDVLTKVDGLGAVLDRIRMELKGDGDPDWLLTRFAWRICEDHLRARPVLDCSQYVARLMNDILGQSLLWTVTLWLVGPLVEKPMSIDGVILSPPTEDKLIIVRRADERSYWVKNRVRVVPSSVLEFAVSVRNREELSEAVTRLIQSLRLFRAEDMEYSRLAATPESIIEGPYVMDVSGVKVNDRYLITEKDIQNLRFHIHELPRLVPSTFSEYSLNLKDPLPLAFKHYQDAVKSGEPHARVAEGIAGLEPVILRKKRRPKKRPQDGHERSPSTSALLADGIIDFFNQRKIPSCLTREEVISAYRIRSRVFHSKPLSKDQIASAFELGESLSECLRTVIVALLREQAGAVNQDVKKRKEA